MGNTLIAAYSDEKHEYKRSRIGVSIGGGATNVVESVTSPVKRMTEVSNSRLKALYGYKTVEEIKKNEEALKAAATGKFNPTISVSIGSSSSESESHSTITEAQGSTVQAGQDVNVKAKEDIAVEGSDILANNVNLEAGKDIKISAAEENETYNTNQSSHGSNIGVNISVGSIVSVNGNFYSGKGNESGTATGYKGSTVTAIDTLDMKSGEDTNIVGSMVIGNKVNADVGGNLNIESLQTKKDYTEESTYVGGGFSVGAGKTSYGGSASKGNMDSNYESVSDQAGIYAGNEGFEITVKENTNLKAGVIDSSASKDKNNLTTGTLTWEDTENKADYSADGMGISYASKDKGSELNQRGLTPNITPTVKDSTNSTPKSAVAEGTITITDKEHQKQDIQNLSRDTKNSLNMLQEIFDKTEVEEKQELMGMLGKYANQMIHNYAESKGWEDGSTEKILLHGAFGALMGDMAGGSAATGALAGGVNEYVIGYLTKEKGEDWVQQHPDTVQWISVGVGAAVGSLAGGNGLDAAGIALSGTKWNYYGSRKDKNGKISGMGKLAALLQPDGTYQYVENVNGTDIQINRDELYKYTSVWIEDPENPGMGYTYIINGDKGDVYYSGSFEDETFVEKNQSVIYSGIDKWSEMESIIPGFHRTDEVGVKNFPGLSLVDELKAYEWSKSLMSNLLTEKVNMVPSELVKQGVGGSIFKGFVRSGGAIGLPSTVNGVINDWNNYSGTRLWKAWAFDMLPAMYGYFGGNAGGSIKIPGLNILGEIGGAIGGATIGDRLKDYFKDRIPTDHDIEKVKGSKG